MNHSPLKLLVGLGNPDTHLLKTRHNVGFWFVDHFANTICQRFKLVKKYDSELLEMEDRNIDIIKPMNYINNSGVAIQKYIKQSSITMDQILVIYDDLDLKVGQIKLKKGGSSGGHNGLNNIIKECGSKDFWRLKIGIGKPILKEEVISYVLSKPSKDDTDAIHQSFNKILENFDDILDGEFSKIMNLFNQRIEKDGF
tara:strand:+ start:788 stop:1381 length:594 start_codon:yes stop_codon:yes gene_type:complete